MNYKTRGGVIGLKLPIKDVDKRNPFRVEQGLLLWKFRADKGYTLAEVAKHIGVAETTLCRWESGQGKVDCENLSELARFYSCNVGELFPAKEVK